VEQNEEAVQEEETLQNEKEVQKTEKCIIEEYTVAECMSQNEGKNEQRREEWQKNKEEFG
jgi:hypothetical protein